MGKTLKNVHLLIKWEYKFKTGCEDSRSGVETSIPATTVLLR